MKKLIPLLILSLMLSACQAPSEKIETSYVTETGISFTFPEKLPSDYKIIEETISYDTPADGFGDWSISRETKASLIQNKNCDSLSDEYLPIQYNESHLCGVSTNNGTSIVYSIGLGRAFEQLPFIESSIFILNENEAIILQGILPSINNELEIEKREFFEKNPDAFFASDEWTTMRNQITKQIGEDIQSGYLDNDFISLENIVKSISFNE